MVIIVTIINRDKEQCSEAEIPRKYGRKVITDLYDILLIFHWSIQGSFKVVLC